MRLIVQRVIKGSVSVEKKQVSKIGRGFFVLVGIHVDDTAQQADLLADKLAKLRIMSDHAGKMNLSVKDVGGSMLVVSQFTLYADTGGGNRPSFVKAARPEFARLIYERFVERLKSNGITVETGEFGEYMEIYTELNGPVTIIIES